MATLVTRVFDQSPAVCQVELAHLQTLKWMAEEKGTSSWLTSLPINEHGFSFHKGTFRDTLAIRYSWQPTEIPAEYFSGKAFSVQHALSCTKGGFPTPRHNKVRDLTASLLTEVCSNVAVEPGLQQLSGEELSGASANRDEGARMDVAADGFWGKSTERAFFNIQVFNPHAPSNRQSSLPATYKKHEQEKKRQHLQHICNVENSTFSTLVFSSVGGMAREATYHLLQMSCPLLAKKWDQPYNTTMDWLWCTLSYSLLRSSILCLNRGNHSSHGHAIRAGNRPPVSVVQLESHWSPTE